MAPLDALLGAQEEVHAASLCLGAARRTNYTTQAGRRHVAAARRRLEQASDRYYTMLMAVRLTGARHTLGEERTPNTETSTTWARKRQPK